MTSHPTLTCPLKRREKDKGGTLESSYVLDRRTSRLNYVRISVTRLSRGQTGSRGSVLNINGFLLLCIIIHLQNVFCTVSFKPTGTSFGPRCVLP